MEQKVIVFDGIQTAIPSSIAKNGACREIINARFRKGCWRPIPEKAQYKPWDISAYKKGFVHDIEDSIVPGEPNHIVLDYDGVTAKLYLLNAEGVPGQIGNDIPSDFRPNVVFLKRTMIVTTSSGLKTFIWNNDGVVASYVEIANLPVPNIELSITEGLTVNNDVESGNNYEKKAHEADAVLGLYYQAINEQNQLEGRLYGSIMYICAYRLFDGSYILHSMPKYLQISNGGTLYRENQGKDGVDSSVWWWKFMMYKIQATINNELYPSATIGQTKDLIDSICVFATKATTLHKIDETTVTMSNFRTWYTTNVGSKNFSDIFPVNDEFKKIIESPGWYKVHEFPFEEVVGKYGRKTETIDTVGFYQDYATRYTLTADQFSHHSLVARSAYVYNDRLHLLNIKTSLGKPSIYWPENDTLTKTNTITGKINVFVKTGNGNGIVSSNVNIAVYRESIKLNSYQPNEEAAQYFIEVDLPLVANYIADSGYYVVELDGSATVYYSILSGASDKYILPAIIGYNDSRAYRIQIIADDKLIFDEPLKKNALMNFSAWTNPSFSPVQSTSGSNYSNIIKLVSDFAAMVNFDNREEVTLKFDTNRLQVSEIQNPLVFPAKNSYQIGTGDGLTMGAGSEPLSSGQFGQFPLQVFTTKGIWAMEIGTGDVLYTNVVAVNSEVINNPDNVVPIGTGVCYTTEKGLFVISGMKPYPISEIVVNESKLHDLTEIPEIEEITTNVKYATTLFNALSTVDFIEYLENSTIGYDHLNKELLLTNYLHGYSYIYSFESQYWYKISKSFQYLINAYPKLLGVNNGNILSISDELSEPLVDCLIVTQPQSFDANEVFKKIENGVLRCTLNTDLGKYAGIYIMASNDLNTWQLITGKQRSGMGLHDLVIQRSHGSAKYYMIIVAGQLNTSSEIKQLNVSISYRLAQKLR